MNYNEALNYIHSLSKFGSKPGLDRVSRLVSLAENPQKDLKFVHIAGTSGKGSTANMISAILQKAGLKVGLFTSPYIIDFKERFMINGKKIAENDFCRLVERLLPLVKKLNDEGIIITEFEFNTVLGLMYFKEQQCDIVCLEVGMGGRFDATNIIDAPLVSVITSIGLDHTDVLGDTIEKIAFEKCGIIKKGCTVVSYPLQREAALSVIKDICNEKGCSLSIPSLSYLKIKNQDIFSSEFTYNGNNYLLNMSGEHQIYNALAAITAAKELIKLGYKISDSALFEGILSVSLTARLEIISKKPLIIIDGAHNADKVKALYTFAKQFKGKIIAVCGMLRDKDYLSAASLIAPLCKSIVTVTPQNNRALTASDMAAALLPYCDNITAVDDISQGAKLAFSLLKGDDVLLCWGSLYIAGEVRDTLSSLL